MICPRCGFENTDGLEVCARCGVELPAAGGSAPEEASAAPGTSAPEDETVLAKPPLASEDETVLARLPSATEDETVLAAPPPATEDETVVGVRPSAPDDATVVSTDAPGTAADEVAVGPTSQRDSESHATGTGPESSAPSPPPAADVPSGWSIPAGDPQVSWVPGMSTLPEGFILADRYRIVGLLGEGGMGSVYAAEDLELERRVAVKLIRPDLASHPEVLKRFKQEIILAREVTHRNVVRIFDLGSGQGLKFITMEFVEGKDLKSYILDGHRFSPDDAKKIISQVCRALDAAHSAGIVHRDLKPQNIMIDEGGNARVMDFGIARSMDLTGMTRTGEMLGTPAYMSPEQAMAQPVDARSDIFSLGVIFYEMLTGEVPFEADTPMASLLKRTRERAVPPIKVDPDIPESLNDVIVRCLETEAGLRYQSARAIVEDLEGGTVPQRVTVIDRLPYAVRRTSSTTRWALLAALLVAVGLGALAISGSLSFGPSTAETPEPVIDPVSLAILPFRNASGNAEDAWLSATLAEMLRSDIGQSARLRTVPTSRVEQMLDDLKLPPGTNFDDPTIARLAEYSRAEKVVSGQYARLGSGIRIDAQLMDIESGSSSSISAQASSEEDLVVAVGELADAVRLNLDLTAAAVAELEATAFTPSTASIEALRRYNEGLEIARDGNYAEARERLQEAVDADPDFALAHSELGQVYADLGFDSEAESASRTAVELSAGLPDYESLLINARHARILGDLDGAIAGYERLLAAAPRDPEIQFYLATLYEQTGALEQARDMLQSILGDDPNYVEALYRLGRVEVRSGNTDAAIGPLNEALSKATGNDEARGRILNAIGIAYKYRNEPEEALRYYRDALEINRRLDQKAGMAANLAEIGQVQHGMGAYEDALESLQQAYDLRREIGDRDGIGISLIDLGNLYLDWGRGDEALQSYKDSLQVQRELGNEFDEALCLNNIGAVHMDRGEYDDALTNLEQALRIREQLDSPGDLGETLHNLGETNAALGRFDEANGYYIRALEQWRLVGDGLGVAAAAHGIGVIAGYEGRFGAALQSHTEAYEAIEDSGVQGYWQFVVTAGYAGSLGGAGSFEEAGRVLQEAVQLAGELENPSLVAQASVLEGKLLLYRGENSAAQARFQAARSDAEAAGDRETALTAELGLARLALQQGPSADLESSLAAAANEAGTLGLRYSAAEAQLLHGQALLMSGDTQAARSQLLAALNTTERLQLRPLLAEGYVRAAETDAATGDDRSATRRYARAVAVLEEIRDESSEIDPLRRADLRELYETASEGSASG